MNLYRRADVHGDRELVLSILERKCEYKAIPVPTLDAVTAPEKVADLRGDWASMLDHQLPAKDRANIQVATPSGR